MTDSIIDGTNINTNVFSYSAPKAHASGGKVVNLYNKFSKESLTISTPLILTWGAQEGKDQQGNSTGKWTMSLQFPNTDFPNQDCQAFLDSMRALEAKVKADAMTYSKEWFGKNITSPEVMDEKFNVMLRHPKIKGSIEPDLSKAPTLTIKVPQWSGVWKSEIYDEEGEPLYVNGKINNHLNPLEFLKPKTHVICLIQCGGLWFVNGKVSITWNLKQAIVQKPKDSLEGKCLLRPKVADKALLKTLPPPEEVYNEASAAIVEDSDNEEEETSYVVPVPALSPIIAVEQVKEQIKEEVSVAIQAATPVVASEEKVAPKKKAVVKKKPVVSEE